MIESSVMHLETLINVAAKDISEIEGYLDQMEKEVVNCKRALGI